MFSWPRLRDADPVLKCEMASTGEVSFNSPFLFYFQLCNYTNVTTDITPTFIFSPANFRLHVLVQTSTQLFLKLCFLLDSKFQRKRFLSEFRYDGSDVALVCIEGFINECSGIYRKDYKYTLCLLFVPSIVNRGDGLETH